MTTTSGGAESSWEGGVEPSEGVDFPRQLAAYLRACGVAPSAEQQDTTLTGNQPRQPAPSFSSSSSAEGVLGKVFSSRFLDDFDFSSARVRLVFSVPGYHSGMEHISRYGLGRLAALQAFYERKRRRQQQEREEEQERWRATTASVRGGELTPPSSASSPGTSTTRGSGPSGAGGVHTTRVSLSWQYSSQGSLDDSFLSTLQRAMLGLGLGLGLEEGGNPIRSRLDDRPALTGSSSSSSSLSFLPPSPPRSIDAAAGKDGMVPSSSWYAPVRVVYPTEDEVRHSREGWRGGLSLPVYMKNCHPFVNARLYRWAAAAATASTASASSSSSCTGLEDLSSSADLQVRRGRRGEGRKRGRCENDRREDHGNNNNKEDEDNENNGTSRGTPSSSVYAHAMPHIKTYAAIACDTMVEDSCSDTSGSSGGLHHAEEVQQKKSMPNSWEYLKWFLLTSANLSKAAWGKLQAGGGGARSTASGGGPTVVGKRRASSSRAIQPPKLTVWSYEMGVLYLPMSIMTSNETPEVSPEACEADTLGEEKMPLSLLFSCTPATTSWSKRGGSRTTGRGGWLQPRCEGLHYRYKDHHHPRHIIQDQNNAECVGDTHLDNERSITHHNHNDDDGDGDDHDCDEPRETAIASSLFSVPLGPPPDHPLGCRSREMLFLPYDILHPHPYASTSMLFAREQREHQLLSSSSCSSPSCSSPAGAATPARELHHHHNNNNHNNNDAGGGGGGGATTVQQRRPTSLPTQDIPWVLDAPHEGPDALGLRIHEATEGFSFYGPGSWTAPWVSHVAETRPQGPPRDRPQRKIVVDVDVIDVDAL